MINDDDFSEAISEQTKQTKQKEGNGTGNGGRKGVAPMCRIRFAFSDITDRW